MSREQAGMGRIVRGYTAEQVRAAEAPHLAAGEPLMQRAAAGLAEHIQELVAQSAPDGTPHVVLLVGSGNNGGDALYAGERLASDGMQVTAVLLGSRVHEAGLHAAELAGVRPLMPELSELDEVVALAASADVIVDGIVGTGTAGRPVLRGLAREVVARLLPVLTRAAAPKVVAVDLPSGIDPDDGSAPDRLVLPAAITVTFGGAKAGLLLGRGAELAGDVRLVEIGIEDDLAMLQPAVELG